MREFPIKLWGEHKAAERVVHRSQRPVWWAIAGHDDVTRLVRRIYCSCYITAWSACKRVEHPWFCVESHVQQCLWHHTITRFLAYCPTRFLGLETSTQSTMFCRYYTCLVNLQKIYRYYFCIIHEYSTRWVTSGYINIYTVISGCNQILKRSEAWSELTIRPKRLSLSCGLTKNTNCNHKAAVPFHKLPWYLIAIPMILTVHKRKR